MFQLSSFLTDYYSTPRRILRSFRQSVFKILTFAAFCITLALAGILVLLFHFGRSLPDHSALAQYKPPLTNRILLSDDTIWRDYAKEHRMYASIDDIPHLVIKAFLAAEDKNFFVHPGLDITSVLRALLKNTLTGRWQGRPVGASTITQQVAKNLLLTNERSFTRKVKEAILSFRLEQDLSKQDILELYLNHIYLGHRCYGIRSAAEYYFGKDLGELSIAEIAYLASLPKAPETYQLKKNPKLAQARRDWVLDRLYEEGYITHKDYRIAKSTDLILYDHQKKPSFHGAYFIEAVRQKLMEHVGAHNYELGGYKVWTTVVPHVQKLAHECLCRGLETYDKRHGYRGPARVLDGYVQAVSEQDEDKRQKAEQSFQNMAPSLHKDIPNDLDVALVQDIQGDHVTILVASRSTSDSSGALTHAGRIDKNSMTWAISDAPAAFPLDIGHVIYVRAVPSVSKASALEGGASEESSPNVSSSPPLFYTLEQIPNVTGGIVIMNPDNGHVYALSGGYHFKGLQYNAASQAQRQTGSAFKTFVYVAALESGYTPQSKVLDAPISIPLGFRAKDGSTHYTPRNYSRRFYGMTTLENGLVLSHNVMSIRLAMHMGMGPIRRIARVFNLHPKLPGQLAMVLGASESTLLNLTTAYAMLANGGYPLAPTLMEKIEDRTGEVIWQPETTTSIYGQKRVVRVQTIDSIKSMLKQVIERGTGRRSFAHVRERHPDVVMYGKTGTTNDYRDAWFLGFVDVPLHQATKDNSQPNMKTVVIGVFVGFPTPKSMGEGESGGRVAAPIGADLINRYITLIKENPKDAFPVQLV